MQRKQKKPIHLTLFSTLLFLVNIHTGNRRRRDTRNIVFRAELKCKMLLVIIVLCAYVPNIVGFEQYQCHPETGRCFWMSSQGNGTMSQGREACQVEGGDLAVMETPELWRFVKDHFRLEKCTTRFANYIKITKKKVLKELVTHTPQPCANKAAHFWL